MTTLSKPDFIAKNPFEMLLNGVFMASGLGHFSVDLLNGIRATLLTASLTDTGTKKPLTIQDDLPVNKCRIAGQIRKITARTGYVRAVHNVIVIAENERDTYLKFSLIAQNERNSVVLL